MRRKYRQEEIVLICEQYLSGQESASALCVKYGLSRGKPPGLFWKWISQYRQDGASAFLETGGNRSYSSEVKREAVERYLNGKGSLLEICAQYHICSDQTLRNWILCYNANKGLKDYDPKREVYMAEARRKTTQEERKEIVEYCISHGRDYKSTAALYEVSYSQVYAWVKKYIADGDTGLADRRGHRKADDEVDELERLHRENLRLKRQLEEKDRLVELLKKVKEFEGR